MVFQIGLRGGGIPCPLGGTKKILLGEVLFLLGGQLQKECFQSFKAFQCSNEYSIYIEHQLIKIGITP